MSDMRIGGLASGMDIDQIVSDLMKVEKTKVDKLEQEKQILEWKQEMYLELNREFANFINETKEEFEILTNSFGVLKSNSLNSLDWVKGATSSDETIAAVDAYTNAIKGSYDVTVDRLADNVSMISSSPITVGDNSNLSSQFGLATDAIIKFTLTTDIGNKTFIFGDTTEVEDENTIVIDKTLDQISIDEVVTKINNAKVTVNGKEVSLGVTASYDSGIDRFFLQTNDTGVDKTIQIDDVNDNFISKLNLNVTHYDGSNNKVTEVFTEGTSYHGVNAQIDFMGAQDIEQSSNQFTINSINFNLKSTGSFTVQVDTDVDAVVEKIKNFVEKYNKLVETVGTKLTEKRYRDYLPLTEEQKEAMSDKEIELWEEKAKSGLLRSDMIISRTMQNIRSWMYENVSGVVGNFDHLTEIGITTEQYSSGTVGGKLAIDEDKLREAIQEDADGVIELLFKSPSDDLGLKNERDMTDEEIEQKRSESGIVLRLYDNLVQGITDIVGKAGPGSDSSLFDDINLRIMTTFVSNYSNIADLEEDILDLDEDIDDMNDYLIQVEDRYWSQFTAMEKAIAQMNQQSMWLMSQFGGGM